MILRGPNGSQFRVPTWLKVVTTASTMLGAAYGYRRNRTIKSAILWSLATTFFWPIAIPIMMVQTLDDRKKLRSGGTAGIAGPKGRRSKPLRLRR